MPKKRESEKKNEIKEAKDDRPKMKSDSLAFSACENSASWNDVERNREGDGNGMR